MADEPNFVLARAETPNKNESKDTSKEEQNDSEEKKTLDKDTSNGDSDIPQAQLSDEEQIVTCYLCDKWLAKPRVLPCVHSFCENCLNKYITEKLPAKIDDDDRESAFHCPVCRFKVKVPNPEAPRDEWVKLLPINSLLVNLIEKLRSDRTTLCDPCRRGNEETEATSWCRDCAEALCKQCTIYHKRVKILMEHQVFSMEDILKQPNRFADKSEICPQHRGKNVEAVCLVHDRLCCMDCVTYHHKSCRRVLPISDIARDVKISKYIKSIEDRMKTVDIHANSVVQSRASNMDELRNQREQIFQEIGNLCGDIKTHMVNLETKIHQELDIMHNALVEEIEDQSTAFSCRQKAINNGQIVLKAALSHGSDENTFILSHKLKKLCEDHERFIRTESKRVYHHDYDLKVNDVVRTFTDRVSAIANIDIRRNPTNIIPAFVKDMVAIEIGEINGRVSSDHAHPWFTSGLFLENGSLVLADFRNKKLKCFDANHQLVSELFLDFQPWGIAEYKPNELIVTLPDAQEFLIVAIENGGKFTQTGDKIETTTGCHDIHCIEDHIVVACSTEARLLTRTGEIERQFSVSDRGTRYLYPGMDQKLCYTTKKSLVCLHTSGRCEFEFSDKELKSPRGVTRDKEGNIYVCGMDSNNIYQLDAAGNLIKVILSAPKDDIKNPYAIGFEPNTTRMFVTQMDCDVVKLYRLITQW